MKEYFSHDYSARDDEKIRNLIFKHSWNGYGLLWAIIESLYQNDGYMQLEYERIAFDLRTDKNIIESIINDFDLFKIKGEKFYSESVLKRLKKRKEKSEKAKKSALSRWNTISKETSESNANADANALRKISESNAIKEKKSKVNKSKENIYIPSWDEFKNYAIEKEPNINLQSLKLKYDAWKENNWKDGKGKKIQNWKSKILNTIPYLNKNTSYQPKINDRWT